MNEEEDRFPKHHGIGYHTIFHTSNHPTNMDLVVAVLPQPPHPKTMGSLLTVQKRKLLKVTF